MAASFSSGKKSLVMQRAREVFLVHRLFSQFCSSPGLTCVLKVWQRAAPQEAWCPQCQRKGLLGTLGACRQDTCQPACMLWRLDPQCSGQGREPPAGEGFSAAHCAVVGWAAYLVCCEAEGLWVILRA